MTLIRIKLKVSGISIAKSGGSATLNINAVVGKSRGQNENNSALTNTFADHDGRRIQNLKTISIKCSKEKAEEIYDLVLLKGLLKGSTSEEKDDWIIVLRKIEDAKLKWAGKNNVWNIINRYVLYLETDSTWIGDEMTVDISSMDIATGGVINNKPENDLKDENCRAQLLDLRELLAKLSTSFGSSYYSEYSSNSNFEFSSYSGDLKVDLANLEDYVNSAGIGKLGGSIKQNIYNISYAGWLGSGGLYNEEIDKWVNFLRESIVWHEVIGLKTIKEIFAAKKNGFTIIKEHSSPASIGNSEGTEGLKLDSQNVQEIKKIFPANNKNYKGFDITLPNNKKTLIDDFRSNDFFGGEIDGINYSEKIKPEECRGFQISDFESNISWWGENMKKIGRIYDNQGNSFLYSKIAIDIWGAPNIDAAIDLAFFGVHYSGGNDKRYNKNEDGDCLLYFNEIKEKDLKKSQILESYYGALKHYNCGISLGWVNYSNDTSSALDSPKKKVDHAYQAIKEFIEVYEQDYKSYGIDKIQDLDVALGRLNDYLKNKKKNKEWEKIKKHWGVKIEAKITEVDERLTILDQGGALSSRIDLVRDDPAIQSGGNKAKAIFDKNETDPEKKIPDRKVLEELKDLVIDSLKAEKDNLTEEEVLTICDRLRGFKNAATTDNKGIAWALANKQRGVSTPKDWVLVVYNKLLGRAIIEARVRLGAEVGKEVTDAVQKDEIVNQIIVGIHDPEKFYVISDAAKLFTKAALGRKATTDDIELSNELRNLRTNKPEAWTIVNNYQPETGKKFAEQALKNLAKFLTAEPISKSLLAATEGSKVQELIAQIKDDDSTSLKPEEKEYFQEKVAKRVELAINLKDSTADATKKQELADLLVYFNKFDYKDLKDIKKSEDLAKKEKDLKKYSLDSADADECRIFTGLNDDEKVVVTELVKEMQAKIQEMTKAQETTPPKKPGMSGWAAFLIVIVVLAALSTLVYFLQGRKTDEEAEE